MPEIIGVPSTSLEGCSVLQMLVPSQILCVCRRGFRTMRSRQTICTFITIRNKTNGFKFSYFLTVLFMNGIVYLILENQIVLQLLKGRFKFY